MAIGHSRGAFATLEAPKVDFGEIALNAQKFNEADIERQQARRAAEAKAKADVEKDFNYTRVDPASVANGTINFALNNTISERQKTISEIDEIQKTTGELTPELRTKRDLAINSAKSLKEADNLINQALLQLPRLIAGSSKISGDQVKGYQNLANRNAIAEIKQTDGDDIEISFYDTDENSNYLMGEDGKFKILTDIDDNGNEVPVVVSVRNIANGSYAGKFYQSNDFPTIIGKYAKTVGAYDTKIENGNVTEGEKLFTKENLLALNETIRTDLRKDRKYTADILSQIAGDPANAKKYGLEGEYNRVKKEYTDEEYKSAEEYTSDKVRASLDTGYSRTIDEPTRININNGSGVDKDGVARLSEAVVAKVYDTPGGKKVNGYVIPFLEANKITTYKGFPITLGGVGIDQNKKTYIEFNIASEQDPLANIDSTSREGKTLIAKRIYLDGPEAEAREFISTMSTISNPSMKYRYKNSEQVRDDVWSIFKANGINVNKLRGANPSSSNKNNNTNKKPSR